MRYVAEKSSNDVVCQLMRHMLDEREAIGTVESEGVQAGADCTSQCFLSLSLVG